MLVQESAGCRLFSRSMDLLGSWLGFSIRQDFPPVRVLSLIRELLVLPVCMPLLNSYGNLAVLIAVVHRHHIWVGRLVASFLWHLVWQLLVL